MRHRAQDAYLVNAFAEVREELTDLQPALAVFAELERRAQEPGVLIVLFGEFRGNRLTVILGQHWLGIEGIDVGRSAVQEQKNDVLGLGREMGRLRAKRRFRLSLLFEQAGQAQHSKSASEGFERLATSH